MENERYELLADCIRSGQIEPDEINRIITEDPAFVAWYKKRFPEQFEQPS